MATVTAGITYKFNTRGFQRASDLIVVEDNTRYVQEIAQLEGMLRKADQQRSVLEMQLKNVKEELNNANSVEMTVPLMPDLAIFFEIGKADLTQKSIINLGYMADVIKQFPAKSFVIFASADKETGTPEFNMALSQKRGEAVHKVLVEKYGVDPSQLRIDAVGSSQQKFDSAQLNRVVVIEDNE
jgi:outer membrane protein OmpA-like peptidoglycan-associated protein